MVTETTILIDVSDTLKAINEKLSILFIDDIYRELVFELAIDCWNLRFLVDENENTMLHLIKTKLNRFVSKEPYQLDEVAVLILSCIKDILLDIGTLIYQAVPATINHLQFYRFDDFNNAYIKVIHDEDI